MLISNIVTQMFMQEIRSGIPISDEVNIDLYSQFHRMEEDLHREVLKMASPWILRNLYHKETKVIWGRYVKVY